MRLKTQGKKGIKNPMLTPVTVPHDQRGEIRNGYPPGIYLPRDPARRKRLLQALGYEPIDQAYVEYFSHEEA